MEFNFVRLRHMLLMLLDLCTGNAAICALPWWPVLIFFSAQCWQEISAGSGQFLFLSFSHSVVPSIQLGFVGYIVYVFFLKKTYAVEWVNLN
jgi:hypothetical protein